MTDAGYCTVDDVRRTLQEASFSGPLEEDDNQAVVDAITAQSEWLQERTNRHWYEPDADDLRYDAPLEHTETLDVPAGPHPDHTHTFRGGGQNRQPRYPKRFGGPYTRVRLTRRDVQEVTELLVRDSSGDVEDWIGEKDEGRGEAYYLTQPTDTGFARLYLHTGDLPRLRDYSAAVNVTYEYGVDSITGTVRDAIAMRAAAKLVIDDEASIGIPDNAQLVNVETKAQQWRDAAAELLEVHL